MDQSMDESMPHVSVAVGQPTPEEAIQPAEKPKRHLEPDRLQIHVLDVQCNQPLHAPYVLLTLGPTVYRTSTAQKSDGQWQEAFEFIVGFHGQLFWSIQLDVWENRTWLPDRHIGRAEIRLSDLEGLPHDFVTWYELWPRFESQSNMSELSRRVVLSSNIGAIRLKVRFNFRKLATLLEAANMGGPALRAELIEAPGPEGEHDDAVAISEEQRAYPEEEEETELPTTEEVPAQPSPLASPTTPRPKVRPTPSQKDVYLLTSPRSRIGVETSEEPADLQRLYARSRLPISPSLPRNMLNHRAEEHLHHHHGLMGQATPEEILIGRRSRASTLETQMFTAKPSFSRSGSLRLSTLSRDALNLMKADTLQRQGISPVREAPHSAPLTAPQATSDTDTLLTSPMLARPSNNGRRGSEDIKVMQPTEVESLGFVDRMQKMLLSEETYTVVRNVKTLLSAFEQGVEFSQAVLMGGAWRLKRFYDLVGTIRTSEIVTSLDEIEMARYFFKFALAAYGWKGLNFFGKRNAMMRDSARMNADKHAIRDFLKIKKEDMLIFEMNPGTVFCPCHFMVYDRNTNSIIIAIRGTMSIFDTLTDLVCDYDAWEGGVVHSGIRTAALQLKQRIEPTLVDEIIRTGARNLFITGHSLGAGTATLLALMLKELLEADDRFCLDPPMSNHGNVNEDFQAAMPSSPTLGKQKQAKTADGRLCLKVHCYAYAPPPIVSLNLACRAESFVSAFITDRDVVCRLCYGTIMDLRSMVIAAIEVGNGDIWVEKQTHTASHSPVNGHRQTASAVPSDGVSPEGNSQKDDESIHSDVTSYKWHFRWQEKQEEKERKMAKKQKRKAEQSPGFFSRVYAHAASSASTAVSTAMSAAYGPAKSDEPVAGPPSPEASTIPHLFSVGEEGVPPQLFGGVDGSSRGRTPDRVNLQEKRPESISSLAGELDPLPMREDGVTPGTRAAQLKAEEPQSLRSSSRTSSRSSSMRHRTRQRKKKMTKKGDKIVSESDAFESLRTARQWILDDPHRNPKLYIAGTIYHMYTVDKTTTPIHTVVERTNAENLAEIRIHKNMFYDHLPSRYDIFLTRASTWLAHQRQKEKKEKEGHQA